MSAHIYHNEGGTPEAHTDLMAETFLKALRRFCSRKPLPPFWHRATQHHTVMPLGREDFFYSEKMRFFFPQTALNGNSYLKGTLGFGADGKGWSVSLNTPLEKVLGRLFVNLNWKCINNKILFNIYYKVNVADFWRFEKKHFTLKTKSNIVV